MVRKRGRKDITGKDTVLHVSSKKAHSLLKSPVNLETVLGDIRARYSMGLAPGETGDVTPVSKGSHPLFFQLLSCKTLFEQLDCLQRFKKCISIAWETERKELQNDAKHHKLRFPEVVCTADVKRWLGKRNEPQSDDIETQVSLPKYQLLLHMLLHERTTPLRKSLTSFLEVLHGLGKLVWSPSGMDAVVHKVVVETLSFYGKITGPNEQFCNYVAVLHGLRATRNILNIACGSTTVPSITVYSKLSNFLSAIEPNITSMGLPATTKEMHTTTKVVSPENMAELETQLAYIFRPMLMLFQDPTFAGGIADIEHGWTIGVHSCCKKIFQCSFLSTDILTQCGMIYGSVVSMICSDFKRKNDADFLRELRDKVDAHARNGSLLSTLALHRGIIASIDVKVLLSPIRSNNDNDEESHASSIIYNYVLPNIFDAGLKSADVSKRTYAFQTLEQLFRNLLQHIEENDQESASVDNVHSTISPGLVQNMLHIVLENWEHPSKRVSSLMPPLFDSILRYQRIVYYYSKCAAEGRHSSLRTFDMSKEQHMVCISKLFQRIINLPCERKAKYKALEGLQKVIGGQLILSRYPRIIKEVIHAVGANFDIASLAASFLTPFLKLVRDEMLKAAGAYTAFCAPISRSKRRKLAKQSKSNVESNPTVLNPSSQKDKVLNEVLYKWRKCWVHAIADGLCIGSQTARKRVCDFILPALFKLDRLQSARLLIKHVASLNTDNTKGLKDEDCIWSMMEIINAARRGGVSRGTSVSPNNTVDTGALSHISNDETLHLPKETIAVALKSANKNLFLSALELICCSKETKAPITQTEMELLMEHFPYLIKNGGVGEIRTRLTVLTKQALRRMYEALKCAKTNMKYRERTKDKWSIPEAGTTGKSSTGVARKAATKAYVDAQEVYAELKQRTMRFLHWFEEFLLNCLYPGAPFERVGMTLELLLLLLRVFRDSKDLFMEFTEDPIFPLLYRSSNTIVTLLNMISISWDQARELACEILKALPSPWPGYESRKKLAPLTKWAILLSGSPRTRESDAGAQVLRLVYAKYALELNWRVPLIDDGVSGGRQIEEGKMATVQFFEDLLTCLEERLEVSLPVLSNFADGEFNNASGTNNSVNDKPPLPHGLFLALKKIISQNSANKTPLADKVAWQNVCKRILSCAIKADNLALTVVAENNFDGLMSTAAVGPLEKGHAGRNNSGEDNNVDRSASKLHEYLARGPVNPNSVLKAPPKVDCRGHLILNDSTMADAQEEQVVVVGSWLTVKETSLLMAELANNWYVKDMNQSMLSFNNIDSIGKQLLRSLLSLKHMGAIASAGQAFYILCKRLFADLDVGVFSSCESDSYACKIASLLPYKWLNNLLSRVDGKGTDKGQVNAEQFFLRRSTGFATAFSSILRSQPNSTRVNSMTKAMHRLFGAAKADETPNANDWRRRVHALNVLKMVFEDAWLSTDLQPHASDAMQLAIDGFRSSSWAVRNSSMMLFSATVRATVGKRREKDDRSRRNRLTGDQFFGRFPALYNYFQKELKDASEYGARTNGFDGRSLDDMHPTLFPILLVLTRLEPSPNGRGSSRPTLYDLNAFILYLRKSAKHPQHKARVMSATALGAILSPEYIVETLTTVLEEAKQAIVQQEHNSLHGSLLMVMAICENVFHQGSRTVEGEMLAHMGIDVDDLKNIVYTFCKFMVNNVLSKDTEVVCFPLCSVLLKIIRLFSLMQHVDGAGSSNQLPLHRLFKTLGIQLAHGMMVGVAQSKILHTIDIGGTQLMELCSEFVASFDTIQSILGHGLLTHTHHEVVLAALKEVKHRVKHGIGLSSASDCRSISLGILSGGLNCAGKSMFVLRQELRLLDLCNMKPLLNDNVELRLKLYDELQAIVAQCASNSPRVAGEAINLLGQVVESIMGYEASSEVIPADAMETLLRILESCSAEDRDMYVRYGCVGALSHVASYFKLTHWKICLRLLQDDDKDVRSLTRGLICDILKCPNYCDGALLRQTYAHIGNTCLNLKSTSVEDAKSLIHHLLAKIEFVASNLTSNISLVASKTRMVTSLKLLFDRPIFETEEMNTHIEVLGEIQLASELLSKLLHMENISVEDEVIARRGDIFSNRIGTLVKQISMDKENHWLGGITYDAGIFASLVANIMGARVCNVSAEHLTRQFGNIASLMHPMLLKITSAPFPNDEDPNLVQNALFAV